MKSQAKVVVIGGGVVGVTHLPSCKERMGRRSCPIEKGELTSGSTWHAQDYYLLT